MGLIGSFVDFIGLVVTRILSGLPQNPFAYSTYISKLQDVMGYVNWFCPFYIMATIFNVWLTAFITCFILFLMYKFVRQSTNI